MECEICGMEYGLSHSCTGVAPALSPEEAAPVPAGFAPVYYMQLAFRIATWNEVAIRRASRDKNALIYGAVFSALATTAIFLVSALPRLLARSAATGGTILAGLALGLVFVWVYMGLIAIVQLGLCHAIAKIFFEARGTLVGVMRPLLLGWFVNFLVVIPVIGNLASAIAWTAVLMLVFEEVDRIGRMQAFLISAGINVVFLALTFFLPR